MGEEDLGDLHHQPMVSLRFELLGEEPLRLVISRLSLQSSCQSFNGGLSAIGSPVSQLLIKTSPAARCCHEEASVRPPWSNGFRRTSEADV